MDNRNFGSTVDDNIKFNNNKYSKMHNNNIWLTANRNNDYK